MTPVYEGIAYRLRWLVFLLASGAALDTQINRTPLPSLVPAVHSVKAHQQDDFILPHAVDILVDEGFANSTLDNGFTLIPPTLQTFAEILASDITELFPHTSAQVSLTPASRVSSSKGYVYLTLSPSMNSTLASGAPSTEGYELVVATSGVNITGAGAKGAFWGTRTLLQGLVQANGRFPSSIIKDQPDWPTRGIMLGTSPLIFLN